MTFPITTHILVPAYDAHKHGLAIPLTLGLQPGTFSIEADGDIADALAFNLRRVIGIMAELKWSALLSYQYVLLSKTTSFQVKNSKSSSLALAILLLNLCRSLDGKPQITHVTGTGLVRRDGSIDHVYLESTKQHAIQKSRSQYHFITASHCQHLFTLEHFLNQF